MDKINIYRGFYPRTPKYTFFSSAHGTFSRTEPVLGHKTSLNKYKNTEITPSIFSDHNSLKLEVNCKKKAGKFIDI